MNIPQNSAKKNRSGPAKAAAARYRRRVERAEMADWKHVTYTPTQPPDAPRQSTSATAEEEPPMSPLSQTRLLLPLLEAIRGHLVPGEYATLEVTTYGSPYIKAATERGNVIAGIDENGLYALDAAGSRYSCDPAAAKDTIYNAIRMALNDAREEWA